MMAAQPLGELAKFVRSKNAKPFRLTFDVIFGSRDAYDRVVAQKVLTPHSIAELYGLDPSDVTSFFEFPAGLAIKFTLRRKKPQGWPGETDVYGCQQHAPLLALMVP
jgi:hypothetical protein